MKAVVMAGGEGTRLRPLTSNLPKPLLPVADRPIMEHILRLLRRHGLTSVVATVQFLAPLVEERFGDGHELGVDLSYALEETPLGTAGSVKNAETELADDTFVVISGDALTDIDLTDLIAYHRRKGALVTVCLTRVPDPREFGIVLTDDEGRIERFLEKPTWGQVFSDTVNTGIYVMEPEVLDLIEPGVPVDWSADVFPRLMEDGKGVYGYLAEGYWQDVGGHESYRQAQVDVLQGRVTVELDGFQRSPGVRVAASARVHPDAELHGPLLIGAHATVEAGARVHGHTVVGAGAVVGRGARLHRAVLHEGARIGPRADLHGCVIGRNVDVLAEARITEGAVVGDGSLVGRGATVTGEARIHPSRTIAAGATVRTSLIRQTQARASLFGARGATGTVNVELTPELAVELATACAGTLPKGAVVTLARDHGRAARSIKHAVAAALQASAVRVHDLDDVPVPLARWHTARQAAGGLVVHTTPGDPDALDILLLDEHGADLPNAAQRRLDRAFARQEYRRALPDEFTDISVPGEVHQSYLDALLGALGTDHTGPVGLRIVVDAGHGSAAQLLPELFGRLGVEALLTNPGPDRGHPTRTPEQRRTALTRLGYAVTSARASFGAQLDPLGERLTLVDDQGHPVEDQHALLTLLVLHTTRRPGGTVVLPVTASRLAEQLAAPHGTRIVRTAAGAAALATAVREHRAVLAADARGGFTVPALAATHDAVAALARFAVLLARTTGPLHELVAGIPVPHVQHVPIAVPAAAKGAVMRRALDFAGRHGYLVDTSGAVEGVHATMTNGDWVHVLPDPARATAHLWAESADRSTTRSLLAVWRDHLEGGGFPGALG
ncbi:sugar phosphate nucleotidyltransferase [Kitasatospora sp. NPDC005856]|uniref:sugar phosphate nucleotidyltransferase n=1 Tax=Kitasatospora sp. NPDC005856 TaxID=3154566 RepID=UPI00340023BC